MGAAAAISRFVSASQHKICGKQRGRAMHCDLEVSLTVAVDVTLGQ